MTANNSKGCDKEGKPSGFCLARNATYCSFCPGYCCYRLPGASLYLDGDDINRIARHFQISDGMVRARYLEGKNTFQVRADGACIFLSRTRIRGRCTIHAARPRQCREFPYGKACPYLENEELLEAILPRIEGWLAQEKILPAGSPQSTPQLPFSVSAIDPETIQAYLETEYLVFDNVPFRLRVGEESALLRAAHTRHGVACSAFITAGNPHSRILSVSANAARQKRLAAELRRRQLAFVPGIGRHPANQWPGEESFLVFGLALDEAKGLANRFAQNGMIWSGADGIPRLVLLR